MKVKDNLILGIFILIVVFSLGTFLYYNIEGWSILDSVYFVVVTVTTVGYADIVPQTNLGKLATIFFTIFGIVMFFYFISLITSVIVKISFKKKISKIKYDLKKQEELKEEEIKNRRRRKK